MKTFFFFAFVLVGISFAQQADGDIADDSLTVFQLDDVMISATRSAKNLHAISRSVDVISNAQIKDFMHQNTGELLSLQTGIFVVGAGQNPGMNQALFMRGAGSHQTAIMVDGVRLTDPSTVNNVADLSELSLLGTDRLEIVRGTHSTLFGSSAVGGVVNILSKKNNTPGMHVDLNGTTGTLGHGSFLHSENVLINYSHTSGLYLSGGVENYSVKGLDATVDTATTGSPYKNRDKDDFAKQDYIGKIGYSDETSDFYFSYKKNSQETDIDRTAFIDDENYTLKFDRNFFTYGAAYQIDPYVELKYIGGYSDLKRGAVNDSSLVDASGGTDHTYFTDDYSGTSLTNELQANLSFVGIEGVIGAGQYKETMNVQSYIFSWSSFGIFESKTNLDTLNLQSALTNFFVRFEVDGSAIDGSLNNLSLGIGGRLNKHDAYGTNVTYEINPSYRIFEGGLLYALHSTGFTAPSLYQLFAPNLYYTSPITRGNKNLQPEKSSSFEIGYKMSIDDDLRFSLAYFTTEVSNSIEYVYLWDGTIGVDTLGNDFLRDDYRGDTYLNVGKVTTSGFEATFHSTISKQISFACNFTYITGTLQYAPAEINTTHTSNHHVQLFNNGAFLNREVESSTLIRRPVTANLVGTYRPISDLALRLDCRIVGERYDVFFDPKLGPFGALGSAPVESYLLIDFSQRYSFDDNVTVSGRIENIFDKKYSDIKGFATRGRSFYVNVHFGL
ncbi:MAG: TonB-dependent receptor [Ignavibacteriales bacterium]|nr:TonB-dependent receptor [Ignavibacteriales bacterium]